MDNFTERIAKANMKTMELMGSVTKLKNGEGDLERIFDLIQEIHNEHIKTICELEHNRSNDRIEIFSFVKKPREE